MCGFKFFRGEVGGGNACRYLKIGISIISSRGTQFKCNKMRGLPIKICKCADQPKVCLLNAGPKCYWTSVFVSVLLFFFFSLPLSCPVSTITAFEHTLSYLISPPFPQCTTLRQASLPLQLGGGRMSRPACL